MHARNRTTGSPIVGFRVRTVTTIKLEPDGFRRNAERLAHTRGCKEVGGKRLPTEIGRTSSETGYVDQAGNEVPESEIQLAKDAPQEADGNRETHCPGESQMLARLKNVESLGTLALEAAEAHEAAMTHVIEGYREPDLVFARRRLQENAAAIRLLEAAAVWYIDPANELGVRDELAAQSASTRSNQEYMESLARSLLERPVLSPRGLGLEDASRAPNGTATAHAAETPILATVQRPPDDMLSAIQPGGTVVKFEDRRKVATRPNGLE